MAVDWLDLARYADTYGYQADRYRATWPWRDWVVRAFNGNLPYDRFVTWQLAGDLLPEPTRDQVLATAFNRHHRQTNEGGSIEEEFRVEYVSDRTNTFATAFLGLTLECARCHSHKYDPITQKEYYQLSSFFASIDESGLYSHFTDATPTPTLLLTTPDRDRAIAAAEAKVQAKLRAFSRLDEVEARVRRFEDWLKSPKRSREPVIAGLIGDFPLEAIDGGKVVNRADAEEARPDVGESRESSTGRSAGGCGSAARTTSRSRWATSTDPIRSRWRCGSRRRITRTARSSSTARWPGRTPAAGAISS